MDSKDVRAEIKRICETLDGDDEYQHSAEDDLRLQFIEWVNDTGSDEQKEIASLLMQLSKADFCRWYA